MALRTDRLVEGHHGPRLQEGRQLGLVGGKVVTSRDLEHIERVDTWRSPRLRSSYSMDHRQEFWDEIRTESKGRECREGCGQDLGYSSMSAGRTNSVTAAALATFLAMLMG